MAVSHRNRRATAQTVNVLRRTDRLDPLDASLVGLARCSADVLDEAIANGERELAGLLLDLDAALREEMS